VKATEQTLAAIQAAPEGQRLINALADSWQAATLRASWSDSARKAVSSDGDKEKVPPLIGIHRLRSESTGNELQVILDGVSTASWKDFETEWKASWRDDTGQTLATTTTNVVVRAESAPSGFVVKLAAPYLPGGTPVKFVALEGTVRRLTAMYHGHGRWMHLARERDE
jgi:hypothetical protein